MTTLDLDPTVADRLAGIALGHVAREYPNVLVQVVSGPGDLAPPSALHPMFFGSFDWHSCVHTHWLLARLLRRRPDGPLAAPIAAHFHHTFTPAKVLGELAYLGRPLTGGFERPYGWAWLMKLQAELECHDGEAGRSWAETLRPLTAAFVRRMAAWLPKADYPVRAGVHSNTAFALAFALDHAWVAGDDVLAATIMEKALAWYGADRDCQAWEPSGDDFLSPALIEAELMRRVLPPQGFHDWFAAFLPRAAEGEPAVLFTPARVSDRSDGKIAHLDGLNLSRAWCWRGIAAALGPGDPVSRRAHDAAAVHLEASLAHVSGDYMGEHWLASFALLALEG
jgi:hypothetical protein